MAEPGSPDMSWIQVVARNRWLRPEEICHAIRNHWLLSISEKPPSSPFSGSLYLYDRRKTRYFRKDGHKWERRKSGNAINEGHMKLKVGNDSVLDCYYARGEDNRSFVRRCYSMREELDLMHIVLVHYLDEKITCISSTLASPGVAWEPSSSSSSFGFKSDKLYGLSKRTMQCDTPGKRFKPSCSLFRHQNEQPPWSEVQLQLANTQSSFVNVASMQRDVSCSLHNSESSSDKGQSSVNAGYADHEGVCPFDNDVVPLLGCPLQVSSIPGTPCVGNSDSSNTFASKDISAPDYPLMAPCGTGDHRFQITETVGLGNSPSLGFQGETPNPHDIDCWPFDVSEEDCCSLPFTGLDQSDESNDMQAFIDQLLLDHSLWMAKKRWAKVCGVMKVFRVKKEVALKRGCTLHQS